MFRRWFSDRRFSFNGTQRIRDNISNLLNDVNQQLVHENPELLAQLSEQLTRLNEMLSGQPSSAAGASLPLPDATYRPPVMTLDASTATGDDCEQNGDQRTPPLAGGRDSVVLTMEAELDGSNATIESTVIEPSQPTLNETVESLVTPVQSEESAASSAESSPPVTASPRSSESWHNVTERLSRPEFQFVVKSGLFLVPFFLLVACRTFWVYPLDAIVFALLFFTCLVASFFVARQADLRENYNARQLITALVVILLELKLVYGFFYHEDDIDNLLTFSKTNTLVNAQASQLCILTIVWYTFITDMAAKILTVTLKGLLILVPDCLIVVRRKHICYQWIELSSQLYRWCLPVIPWYTFLRTPFRFFSFLDDVISLLYVSLKAIFLIAKIGSWWSCTKCVAKPFADGTGANEADMQKAGATCSICLDTHKKPTKLACTHVFCEECVAVWLDKETTCPICRAPVGEEDKTWRDGSTSMALILF